MTYEIDQSGKIEDTARNTVLAYANSSMKTIIITRKVKRKIQELFRKHGMRRSFIYHTFAAGVYHLIRNFKKQESIVIDMEYPGKDQIITKMIQKILQAYKKPAHNIEFRRIGNHPKVHYAAYDVFAGKKKADLKIGVNDLIEAIKKTDGRFRECFSTLVGVQSRSMNYIYQKKGNMSSLKT